MVGGGFIGLEVAENLCDLGVKVTVDTKTETADEYTGL